MLLGVAWLGYVASAFRRSPCRFSRSQPQISVGVIALSSGLWFLFALNISKEKLLLV